MLHPSRVQILSVAKQRRLDELLNKNSEGTITDLDRRTLEQLVSEAEQLMVENAQRLESQHQFLVECQKLDPAEEQRMAEEWLDKESESGTAS